MNTNRLHGDHFHCVGLTNTQPFPRVLALMQTFTGFQKRLSEQKAVEMTRLTDRLERIQISCQSFKRKKKKPPSRRGYFIHSNIYSLQSNRKIDKCTIIRRYKSLRYSSVVVAYDTSRIVRRCIAPSSDNVPTWRPTTTASGCLQRRTVALYHVNFTVIPNT